MLYIVDGSVVAKHQLEQRLSVCVTPKRQRNQRLGGVSDHFLLDISSCGHGGGVEF